MVRFFVNTRVNLASVQSKVGSSSIKDSKNGTRSLLVEHSAFLGTDQCLVK